MKEAERIKIAEILAGEPFQVRPRLVEFMRSVEIEGGLNAEELVLPKVPTEEKVTVDRWLYNDIKRIAKLTEKNCKKQLIELLAGLRPKTLRTSQQNRALHKDCALIAKKLNDAGKDMRLVLKPSYFVPWTTESVKEHIFKPIMKALYQHESTTELEKYIELETTHDVLMRELGEKHGIEYHFFPHDPVKQAAFEGRFDSYDKAVKV